MKALVIGLGISGKGAMALLQHLGWETVGYDDHLPHTFSSWNNIELVVVSPGVPPAHPLVQEAGQRGIETIGEIELACRHLKNRMLGVTGTNGKTTVTLLAAHLLQESGYRAIAVGNVGTPLSMEVLAHPPNTLFVTELSSFQIDTMSTRCLEGGVLLNVTPDHLDRYGTIENYAASKLRMQDLLKAEAPFYVYAPTHRQFPARSATTYGLTPDAAWWSEGKTLFYDQKPVTDVPALKGHNLENFIAAFVLCSPWGVKSADYQTFQKPRHRIEFVREWEGITFFDDSKGTNLDAVMRAVETFTQPLILIAGGVDKGAPYLPWIQSFKGKVTTIFALGEAAEKIEKELGDAFSVNRVATLEQAVWQSAQVAKRGDVVLLSPGCASYDMFRNYAHRGEEFQRLVREL